MYLGFIVMLAFLVAQHGGLGFLARSLPPTHFTWHGGNPPASILVWYFIALSTLVDPGFWQRAYAARDPRVARNGVLLSVACWIVFDFLTTTTGLYARAVLPRLTDPVYAFPELAKVTLPPFALGLFYLAMIATVMSTVDSYGFIAAGTLGRDLFWRLRRGTSEEQIPHLTRIGLWLSALTATVLALADPSVVGLWHDLGSITTPALLLPVGTALLGKARVGPLLTTVAMVAAFAVSTAWVLVKAFPPPGWPPGYPFGLEPIYAGLGASLLLYAIGWATGSTTGPRTGPALGPGEIAS
jgi:SSS family solute:Na+ symporter